MLISESTAPVQLGPGLKVLAGEWDDRYTGRRVMSPIALGIDHLVSATLTAVDREKARQDVTGIR